MIFNKNSLQIANAVCGVGGDLSQNSGALPPPSYAGDEEVGQHQVSVAADERNLSTVLPVTSVLQSAPNHDAVWDRRWDVQHQIDRRTSRPDPHFLVD